MIRERQRGCEKIGLLLRLLFPPFDATCPARAWWAPRGHVTPGRGGRVKTNQTKSLHVSRHVEIMRRDFVVRISIFSMPRCLGSESPSRVSTGFHVIVVFLVSDRGFVFGFCSWMLSDLSIISGFVEWTSLVRECNTCGSVSFVFVAFCFVFCCCFSSWFC